MRPSHYPLIALTCLTLAASAPVASATSYPLANDFSWSLRNPYPSGEALLGVTASADAFVAAGLGGTVLHSHHGAVWQPVPAFPHEDPVFVGHFAGRFFLVGRTSVSTSPDGWSWTTEPLPAIHGAPRLTAAAAATRNRIAITTDAGLLISSDGVSWQTWDLPALPPSTWVAKAVALNDRIVLATSAGVFTATSAGAWQPSTLPTLGGQTHLHAAPDAVLATGSSAIATSPDGLNWTTAPAPAALNEFAQLHYDSSTWILVPGTGAAAWTSQDFVTWTPLGTSDGLVLESLARQADGPWVSVGRDGSIGSSLDGSSWVRRDSGIGPTTFAITRFGDRWVAVGARATALVSTDGLSWTQVVVAPAQPHLILDRVTTVAGKVYAAAGNLTFSSSDGLDWTPEALWPNPHGWDFSAIPAPYRRSGEPVWAGDRWLLTATPGLFGTGAVFSSFDGTNWERVLTSALQLSSVAGRTGTYVAVGGSTVYFSADGSTWSTLNVDSNTVFTTVIEGGGWFAAGTAGGQPGVFVSQDGQFWQRLPELAATVHGGARIGDTFWFTGQGGTILEVNAAPAAPIANLSTQGFLDGEGSQIIAGYVVEGTGAAPLLVRAVGDGLRPFGLTDVAQSPDLTLFTGATTAFAATAWEAPGSIGAVESAAVSAGAFPLRRGSGDAALVQDTVAGAYTAVVAGSADSTGAVLLEIYDTRPAGERAGTRLRNTSTRGKTSAAHPLIGGFVIDGDRPRQVLIRAIGPGLAPFNVANPSADTALIVFGSSGQVAANDNWYSNPDPLTVADVAAQVGAFPLVPGSKDAAVVATLAPGGYTVHVTPSNEAGAGEALFEIYFVD